MNISNKTYTIIGIIIVAVVIYLLFFTTVFATQDKVTICHASSSDANPYIVNQPNKSGDVGGHDDHNGPIWFDGIEEDWGDIIPPFDYGEGEHYAGKNWTAEGIAIYENDCEIPGEEEGPTSTPSPTESVSPTPTDVPDCEKDEDCVTPTPPIDVCLNIVGNQSEVPANMQANSDHICSCQEGYHEVATDYKGEQQEEFTCEPDVAPTPSPEPTREPEAGQSGSLNNNPEVSQPVCTFTIAPALLQGFERVNATSVRFSWWKSADAEQQAIIYGYSADNMPYSQLNIGDVTSFQINDLQANTNVFAKIRTYKGACNIDSNIVDP